MDELELGLPPSKKKPRAAPGAPKARRTWRLYKVKNSKRCDICVTRVEKVNGWPVRAIDNALFVEQGPDGNVYLCAIHKEERESTLRET